MNFILDVTTKAEAEARDSRMIDEMFAKKKKKEIQQSWERFLIDYVNAEDDFRDNSSDVKEGHEYDFHAKAQYPYEQMELSYQLVLQLKQNQLWQVFDVTKLLQAMNNLQRTYYEYQHVYTSQCENVRAETMALILLIENPEVIEFVKQGVTDRIFNISEYEYWQEKLEKLFYTVKREEAPEEVSFYEDSMSEDKDSD